MKRQINQGRRHKFHRRKALIIGSRRQQPRQHIRRHRSTRRMVPRVFFQHLRHFQPMFIQLAWQFDKIARHRCAGYKAIGHIRQHLVQGMAKFMKQRARIVIRQQARLPLGKVAHIHHDGAHRTAQLALASHRRTPGPRPFRSAREIIADKHRHMGPLARHLPSPHIRVIQGHRQFPKLQPEQAARAIKLRPQHRVQAQIGLQRRLIQIMLGQPALFGIIAPIPRLQIAVDAVRMHHRLQHRRVRIGAALRRFPDPHQQIAHRAGRFRHLRLQLEIGKAGIAQQFRPLLAQGQRLRRNAAIVGGIAIRPP